MYLQSILKEIFLNINCQQFVKRTLESKKGHKNELGHWVDFMFPAPNEAVAQSDSNPLRKGMKYDSYYMSHII